ncbi:hypothetical protein [Streptomyces antimicrobicus]|uniref:Uncharacterized protein n=1 Tax=Streptomyces antimicrobicus TaxID=2883108 RepID=A0ABS8BA88_9ACTN|nr:hypothetical protein [Streptomyces antimicrobicus]MCB5181456.1 hypothetical protein [Streptomyces antimicrobicus]
MSQESVPEHTGLEPAVPAQSGAPKGLLQQMEELMAALNADLSQLDADLQSSSAASASSPATTASPAPASSPYAPASPERSADGGRTAPRSW